MTAQGRAIWLAFLAAVLWGLWWIPLRGLGAIGLPGLWATLVMNTGALAVAAILMVWQGAALRLPLRPALGAALLGLAVTSFSLGLLLSDVVRAILLFYLAPAWSKIIETVFLRHRWGWGTTVALFLSFTGAFLILGGGFSTDGVRSGDALALLAGIAWSAGAALIFVDGRGDALPLSAVTAGAALVVSLVAALWLDPVSSAPFGAVALGLLAGGGYVLPILYMTIWSARRLAPATLSFLLTAEIVTGVGTGVLFLNEPFGLMQALGAALIILGATFEIVQALARPYHSP